MMELFSIPEILKEEFIFDDAQQFHVLKHFSEVDEKYLLNMSEHDTFSQQDILDRMKNFGSKFHPDFVANPMEVFDVVINTNEYKRNYRSWSEHRIELQLIFDKSKNPNGIGTDTLLAKHEFDSNKEIEIRMRKDFPVQYSKGEPNPTWELHFIFVFSENNWRLVTLFPGKYAPPFPDRQHQEQEEYEEYAEFWNSHIFLVK